MQRKFFVLVVALSLSPFLYSVRAQIHSPANPDSALQLILDNLEGTPLSLQDGVQLALGNATAVRLAEAVYQSSSGSRRKEAGYFDPALFFTFNHLDGQSPTASFFAGANVLSIKQDSLNGGIRWNLPTGTSVSLSLNTVRFETNSTLSSLNPQYSAFGMIAVRQPLLGGFFVSAVKNLTKADYDLDAAKARYDQEVLATTTQTEHQYWDLYAAERDYAVQKLTRDRAEAFLKETETRARIGLVGPNQVANARTFLAEQEILLLDSEEHLSKLSDQLASLIGKRPESGKERFLTIDSPPSDFPSGELDALIALALERNLVVQAAKAEVEGRRALSKAAFWQALPQIDLIGSLGGNGLTGTPQDVVFQGVTLPRSTLGGSLGDAISTATKRKFPTWSLGVNVSIPIGLRSGFGEEDRLEAEVVLAEQRRIQIERLLEEHVRASYRDLFNGKRRLKAGLEGVEASAEQVRIGLIEFQNGRSTAFELVRLGADFAAAQQRYTQALVRSAKAAANLKQLTSGAYPGQQ